MGTRTRTRARKAAEEATAPPEKTAPSEPEAPVAAVAQGAPPELLDQLRAAAAAFGGDAAQVSRMLATMAEDVRRARACPLPIFPVLHHSPASAVHMVRWLHERAPKVVFVELCEDLLPVAKDLAGCKLPVALQAFSGEAEGFPPGSAPLSVVAPITEFSAEFQAIAYAMTTGAELIFVDRSVDHVFQQRPPGDDDEDDELADEEDEESDTARMHGESVGLEVGSFATFREFRDLLLHNARMGQLEEWMSLYVEEPTIGASTETYREVLFLVGSLFRRLGSTRRRREEIRVRDRYMWTRIKEALAAKKLAPEEAVFICGAAHAVDDECPEWGLDNDLRYDIPARTATRWQYGLIPSSYGAIEHQFGYDRGAVALAEARWHKARDTQGIAPFGLGESKKSRSTKAPKIALPAPPEPRTLQQVIAEPPGLLEADREELLHWCTGIVESARQHQYLASTADAIAIYETAVLLARVRARNRPSPSDFVDAAETCLEKGNPPGKKSIRTLARAMLGGDRVGQVAYDSLPPLVQDVYDRLAVLGITAKTSRVTRVLMDFGKNPHLREVSALLWRLHHLLPGTRVARPIMGKLELGVAPAQESWDVCVHGAEQRSVIQLSFEGLTVETVLERRLRDATFGPDARTVTALASVETSLLLLDNPKLTESIGQYSVQLLMLERGADDAGRIFEQIRKLVHHFRTTPQGPPHWLNDFVAKGYQHYTTQLPEAFQDRGTSPEALSAMLSFVFTLESLALAMGCSRSQLVLSLEHATSQTSDPEKLGLLWASRWLVQLSDEATIRASFAEILEHPLGRTAYPRYLSGFLLALSFAPRAAALAVDLLGRAFAELPDRVLLPWMPALIDRLRPRMADALPTLFQEFARSAPRSLRDLDKWAPPWSRPLAAPARAPSAPRAARPALPESARAGRALLFAHRAAPSQHALALGLSGAWGELAGASDATAEEVSLEGTAEAAAPDAPSAPSPSVLAVRALLARSASPAAHTIALGLG